MVGKNIEKRIKLFSRKNNVFLVTNPKLCYVEKIFADRDKYKNELLCHSVLETSKVNVPKVYSSMQESYTINYEYVEGPLLSYCLAKGYEDSFCVMGMYLRGFHDGFREESVTLLAGDVNLRNFIFKDGGIVPLDYEEYKMGYSHEDVSTFLSHLVSHREVDKAVRLAMGRVFLKSYYGGDVVPSNLGEDIRFKGQNLATFRGFNDLEEDILLLIEDILA